VSAVSVDTLFRRRETTNTTNTTKAKTQVLRASTYRMTPLNYMRNHPL